VIHGSSYQSTRGDSGLVKEFAETKTVFRANADQINHRCEWVEGQKNTVSENLVRWLWKRLLPALSTGILLVAGGLYSYNDIPAPRNRMSLLNANTRTTTSDTGIVQ
jgi:6-pyruvoyl-tetrahydropterin synthase